MATTAHNNLNAKLVSLIPKYSISIVYNRFLSSHYLFENFWQVLLGDMGAGKSSLVLRFVKGQFLEFQVSGSRILYFLNLIKPDDGGLDDWRINYIGIDDRSGVFLANGVGEQFDGEVRDQGNCWPRALPQLGPHVLQGTC